MRVSVLLRLLLICLCFGAPLRWTSSAFSQQESEQPSCKTQSDCPPIGSNQDPRCASITCNNGSCVEKLSPNKVIGDNGSACLSIPLVCQVDGSAQEARPQPINNGKACALSNLQVCKKGLCSAGECQAANATDGTACGAPAIDGCWYNQFSCYSGKCTGRKSVKDGAQCATLSDGTVQMSSPEPAWYTTLKEYKTATSQLISCDKDCHIQMCAYYYLENCKDRREDGNCTHSSSDFVAQTGSTGVIPPCLATQQAACYSFASNLKFSGPRAKSEISDEEKKNIERLNDKIKELNKNIERLYKQKKDALTEAAKKIIRDKIKEAKGEIILAKDKIMLAVKAHAYRDCMLFKSGLLHTISKELPQRKDSDGKLRTIKATDTFTEEELVKISTAVFDCTKLDNKDKCEPPRIDDKNAFSVYSYIFMDNQCNLLGSVPYREESLKGLNINSTCGGGIEFAASASPISLLLDDGYDIERDQAIVSFPVNPGTPGKLFTWKGSGLAPLLVYDPLHTGKIRSASQLFGNWTFGGKRVASLLASQSTPWRNGYEALGSIDHNEDRIISGDELRDLALWFDANRNAVAEQGEVQALDQHGITKLFYEPDHRDPKTRSIIASRGFTRLIDGKEVVGRSIDWYAASANSLDTLLAPLSRQPSLGSKEAALPGDSSRDSVGLNESNSVAALEAKPSLAGVWSWQALPDQKINLSAVPRGSFILFEDEERDNVSLVSASHGNWVTKSSTDPMFGFLLVDMNGKTRQVEGEGLEVDFNSASEVPGAKLNSTAKVINGGKELRGFTVVTGRNTDGSEKTLRYEWSATKER